MFELAVKDHWRKMQQLVEGVKTVFNFKPQFPWGEFPYVLRNKMPQTIGLEHLSASMLNYFSTADLNTLAHRIEILLLERRITAATEQLKNENIPEKLRYRLTDKLNTAINEGPRARTEAVLTEIEEIVGLFSDAE